MTLVVVKTVTLNQCRVVWNEITVVESDGACNKKENCVDLLRRQKEGQPFLGILGPILKLNIWSGSRFCTVSQAECRS